jgi:hypothetical protein
MTRLALFPFVALAVLVFAACETTDSLTSNDIVDTIPWEVPETTSYRVLDKDDDNAEVGTLEMRIEETGQGQVLLTQAFEFPEAGFTNLAEVVVTADELIPSSSHFRIDGPDGVLDCQASYAGTRVSAHRVGEDAERTDDLDIPQISYDSWADLFLWRTIPFTPGLDLEYTDVLACTLDRTQKFGIELDIGDSETVNVPAGEYEAWKIEIKSGTQTQEAWYSTDDSHVLVKYDNGSELFELTSRPD